MNRDWRIAGATPGDTDALAAWLALILKPGDLIALEGELGAGKTSFARALISHIAGSETEEIPSPSFALAQTYETPRYPVMHVDCYRLTDEEEARELGIEEALEAGPVLVEWPERIAGLLPDHYLGLRFDDAEDDSARDVTLTGHGDWAARLARLKAMRAFCDQAGWGDARVSYLQGDASPRAYARLERGQHRAILMDSPRTPDGPPIRDGKPYSQIAHIAEDVRAFAAIAACLGEAGFSVPAILAQELEGGFLVIEDMGDRVYGPAIAAGDGAEELYMAAAETLVALRGVRVPQRLPLPGGGFHVLPPYDEAALEIEVELLLDWFWPLAKGGEAPEAARDAYLACWRPLFEKLAGATGWVLRDYHSPNLIWLPEREGIARVGIIDFQDAVDGHPAYDLVSLGQDARRDVPAELEAMLFDHYCAETGRRDPGFDRDAFGVAYAILGAQRSSKILGIFARLAKRDGKRGYLAHLPRVSGYLERNLVHPKLSDLRKWYNEHLPASLRETAG